MRRSGSCAVRGRRHGRQPGKMRSPTWANEMLATRLQEDAIKREIANIKPVILLGLVAKLGVWIDMHGDNSETMIGHPIGKMREAVTG
jgi:hypothetical protein